MPQTETPTAPPKPPSNRRAKLVVWILLAVVVIAAVIGYLASRESAEPEAPADGPQVVREDSHVLSQAPDETAVLVEFLDFECESCRAAYPVVEHLRSKYGQNVTIVNRYFPLPGHRNSMNAAVAVEAAAQQGSYEAMYSKMFETQADWGESADDKSALFRTYAEGLDLDMAAYDSAVEDPATQERVKADIADGTALGVAGTPTFFLDGKPLEVGNLEEFEARIAEAAK